MSVSLCALTGYSQMKGIGISLLNREGSMISASRNGLVEEALRHPQHTHVLFIDADMQFPPDALVKLLDHDKHIVGCIYNKRVPPYETLGTLVPDGKPVRDGGLREATFMPGGFMLIKTAVFRALEWPWYFERFTWPGVTGADSLLNELRDKATIAMPEDMQVEGRLAEWLNANLEAQRRVCADNMMSEDLSMCLKARNLGYKIWCDLDLTFKLVHLGELPVTCLPEPDTQAKAA